MTLRNDIMHINIKPRIPRGRILVPLAITYIIVLVRQIVIDPQSSSATASGTRGTHKIVDNHFTHTESNIGIQAIDKTADSNSLDDKNMVKETIHSEQYDDDALFTQGDDIDIDALLLNYMSDGIFEQNDDFITQEEGSLSNINGTAANFKNSAEIIEFQDGESTDDDFAIESYNDPQYITNTNTKMDKSKQLLPQLEPTDVIFDPSGWGNPIIIEEFKLAFFTIPKVGCTQWKLLFRRMEGLPDWDPAKKLISLHRPSENGLKYLSDYSLEKAQEILISDEWTKAVFMREPKERIVSAFLDKFVSNAYFCDLCLPLKASIKKRQNCRHQGRDKRNFSYFLRRAVKCKNMHWNPQADAIDAKWWPLVDFVGYMDSVATDTKQLLQSIHSQSTGENAWNLHGKTGWGKNGTSAFMQKNNAPHARSAHDKIREYYSKCREDFVEKYWEVEWTHGTYHFDRFRLVNDTVDRECKLQ